MKLLHALAPAPWGDTDPTFTRLLATLAGARRPPRQLVLIRPNPQQVTALQAVGVQVETARFGERLDWRTRRHFGRLVETFTPDLVLTWHEQATRYTPRGYFMHAAWAASAVDVSPFVRCHHVLTTDHLTADRLRAAGLDDSRVHRMPPLLMPLTVAPLDRAQYDTPPDVPLLACVGSLVPEQGQDLLLPALKELPGVYLWLLGRGPRHQALHHQAHHLGVADRVRFLDRGQSVDAVLASADVLVVPARAEGRLEPVVRGWAAGLPVISTATRGATLAITEGIDGVLCPPDDGPALVETLVHSMRDEALMERIMGAGETTYAEKHAPVMAQRAYITLLSALAAGQAPEPVGG